MTHSYSYPGTYCKEFPYVSHAALRLAVTNEGQQANLTCHNNYRFTDGSNSVLIKCNGSISWDIQSPLICEGKFS